MRIDELSSKKENRFVTITMSYEDVRDTANALYYLKTGKKPEADYSEIFAKFSFLFDMIKHGMVQPNTIQKLAESVNEGRQKSSANELSAGNNKSASSVGPNPRPKSGNGGEAGVIKEKTQDAEKTNDVT